MQSLEARLKAHATEAERLVDAAEEAGREEIRKVLAEGFVGLRAAAKLGSKQSSYWTAEAEFAAVESKVEEQAEAAWSEALKNQLAAKKQRQLRAELEMQEKQRVERLETLQMEKREVLLEEEAQKKARLEFRKEGAGRSWKEFEDCRQLDNFRSVDLEMQQQQHRMHSWYAEESAALAAREEERAEAWLNQVWARAEAQAEKEVHSVQLQQRVWHVEALAEEAAAREVAGRQAEAEACATAIEELKAAHEAACNEQLAWAEEQHKGRCKELEEQGLEAARRESQEQEMRCSSSGRTLQRPEGLSGWSWNNDFPIVSDAFDREVLGVGGGHGISSAASAMRLLESWEREYDVLDGIISVASQSIAVP
eukprot:g10323.t1